MASSIGSQPAEPRVPWLRYHESDIESCARASVLSKPKSSSGSDSESNNMARATSPIVEASSFSSRRLSGSLDGCQLKLGLTKVAYTM